MQRIFIALALALTLTCAFGGSNAIKLVKPLAAVVADGDTNFTNTTSLNLIVTNPGELQLARLSATPPTDGKNMSAFNIAVWLKKVDTKALGSTGANSSLAYVAPIFSYVGNGYIVAVASDNETNTPALRLYQQPLSGGAAIGRVTVGNNANASFTPAALATVGIGKTGYIFYRAGEKIVNFTSFTVGGALGSNVYTLTSAYDVNTFAVTWGEALGSNQVLASWQESGVLKDAVVDVSKGTATANAVGGVNVTTTTCRPYSTDKKWFGEFCTTIVTNNGSSSLQTWIRNGTASVQQLSSYNASVVTYNSVEPYGPYLAVFFSNANNGTTTHSYEIWNLDTLQPFVNKTDFLSVDGSTTYSKTRVPAGGVFALVYTSATNNGTTTLNTVQVGQVLSSSSLVSVLGFIMTIVAGLFLF